jgi:hypothetical protein
MIVNAEKSLKREFFGNVESVLTLRTGMRSIYSQRKSSMTISLTMDSVKSITLEI